ncbi:hypothetical protein DPMN_131514 [Dreissena polymorpha]|uniref:Uncharacterized protein n=1 Tax=Dreissena polymorpha TaxID=45954 RepID=A0A9D4K2D9_DREPO|nr:hypothetical protein DPMN_131514 [Dreissena polymorpha]
MAVSWNLPHITYVGSDEELGNKKEFALLTRMSYTMNSFARFYIEVGHPGSGFLYGSSAVAVAKDG